MKNIPSKRGSDLVIWVCGAIDECKRQGWLSGGNFVCTPKGLAEWDQIIASDFVPTTEEVAGVIKHMCGATESYAKEVAKWCFKAVNKIKESV